MTREKLQRRKKPNYIFVLWGDGFEEIVATTFVTHLRNLGLCVRLVGLHGQRIRGKHGLALCADITVTAALALAPHACCIIVPCSTSLLHRMNNDPRIAQLFLQAKTNNALFIIREPEALETPLFQTVLFLGTGINPYIAYADYRELNDFASAIAQELVTAQVRGTGQE